MKLSLKKIISLAIALSVSGISHAQESDAIWQGAYSEAQASRGEAVYREACIACHGQDLGGNSNSPGLVGMGFMFLWENRSVAEFFEKIRSEMPTDRPGQLPEQDYLDVVSYLLKSNGFPAGEKPLIADSDALESLKITSRK